MYVSLKASWSSKIYHNGLWRTSKNLSSRYFFFDSKLFPFFQLKSQHIELLLKEILDLILLNITPFFKDVLNAWLSFQYYPPNTPEDIQNQIIWMIIC